MKPTMRIVTETGPTGLALFHVRGSKRADILWLGPGGGLFLVFGRLVRIEHPTADATFETVKEARAAVRSFMEA